jgi:hypothetical protein
VIVLDEGAEMIKADGLFGHVNDSIRGLATVGPPDERWEFICECPDLECHAPVTLTLDEFDARRSASPPSPIVSLAHAG